MTGHQGADEKLVAALGWQPCEWDKRDGYWYCDTHIYGGYATRPCVCSRVADRLADVRLGMALVLAEQL